jgi:hypothetical protein
VDGTDLKLWTAQSTWFRKVYFIASGENDKVHDTESDILHKISNLSAKNHLSFN